MADEEKPPEQVREADFTPEQIIYVNHVEVMISPEEVILRLAIIRPDVPGRIMSAGLVYMTQSHGKRLARILSDSIDQWEANYGEIEANPVERIGRIQLERRAVDQRSEKK